MWILVFIKAVAATGVVNLPDGGGGFLPSVHLLCANPRYLSLIRVLEFSYNMMVIIHLWCLESVACRINLFS